MGSFVKKTLTGYKEVPGGYSDPEAEYYIETMKEYQSDVAKLRKAEESVAQAKREAEDRVKQAYASANRQLSTYRDEADREAERKVFAARRAQEAAEERVHEALARAEKAEAELERQRFLNGNLKRIARERANQDRGLKPKKEHPGYLVLRSDQWTERYIEDGERKEAAAWKSILQTPYNASLPLNQVKDDIYNDLYHGILTKIGFKSICGGEEDMGYRIFTGKDESGQEREVNGLYRWKYRANYKAGLWELELYHTKSLRVPPELRPR